MHGDFPESCRAQREMATIAAGNYHLRANPDQRLLRSHHKQRFHLDSPTGIPPRSQQSLVIGFYGFSVNTFSPRSSSFQREIY